MENEQFVSRAGSKLQFALNQFKIDIKNKICADFGCSTGGFTDCLLENGAEKVYAIDTAYGELAWKLRNDNRVVVLERTNALFVILPEKVNFVSVDVGWTKQALILENVIKNLDKNGEIVSLIKPHYEAPKNLLQKGVLRPEISEEVFKNTIESIKSKYQNLDIIDVVKSPIEGKSGGNTEYLAYMKLL